MSGWKLAWGAARGYARTSASVSRGLNGSLDQMRHERVPRNVVNRGYLAPGDPPLPPGADLMDYSGLDDPRTIRNAVGTRQGITIGAVIDLQSGVPTGAYRLPLERFFQHLAVVAPPGKGKTYSVIAPLAVRLLRAGVTVVALDVTGNLLNEIKEFSAGSSQGLQVPLHHWSTDESRGRHSWNPLQGLESGDLTAIEGIKTSILGSEPADPSHRFFFDRENRILGAVLRLVSTAFAEPTLTNLVELLVTRDVLRDVLSSPRHRSEQLELHDYLSASDEDAAAMVSDTLSRLSPFLQPQIAAQVNRSDFTIERALQRPSLVIVGAELDLGRRSEMAASMFVNRLSAVLARRYGSQDGVPVVILMDEAPVLARRINLSNLLATARAARAGVVLAAQMVTQMGDADTRSNIFDACDALLVLPGASAQSVELFKSRLGRRMRVIRDVTHQYGERRGSVTHRQDEIDVLGNREIMSPPFGMYPAFIHSRSDGLSAVALELDRYVVNSADA